MQEQVANGPIDLSEITGVDIYIHNAMSIRGSYSSVEVLLTGNCWEAVKLQ